MKNLLHHLFLQKPSNNYRPKLLHHKVLFVFILFFFSAGLLMPLIKTNFPSVLGISANVSTQDLLILTNGKRQENGLGSLTIDDRLNHLGFNPKKINNKKAKKRLVEKEIGEEDIITKRNIPDDILKRKDLPNLIIRLKMKKLIEAFKSYEFNDNEIIDIFTKYVKDPKTLFKDID